MIHVNNPRNSEVDAYSYITEELKILDWIVKNPARVQEGEVYKQNESLANSDLKEALVRDMPEATVKINECDFWIIESKRDKKEINKAVEEAKQYASKVNKSKKINCIIISGVAGNDIDGFSVVNQYLQNNKWETILFNGKSKDTLLSKQQVKYIISRGNCKTRNLVKFCNQRYEPRGASQTINSAACGGESPPP